MTWSGSGMSPYDGAAHGVSVSVTGIQGAESVLFNAQTNYAVNGFSSPVTNGNYHFTSRDAGEYAVTAVSMESVTGYDFSSTHNYTLTGQYRGGRGEYPIRHYAKNAQSELDHKHLCIFGIASRPDAYGKQRRQRRHHLYVRRIYRQGYRQRGRFGGQRHFSHGDITLPSGSSSRNRSFTAYKAGVYTITVSLKDMPNYALSGQSMGEWTIERAVISVVWSGGGSSQYNGGPQGLTATVSGIKNNERVIFDLTSGFENSGIISGITEVSNGSYSFTSVNASASAYTVAINSITEVTNGNEYSSVDNYMLSVSGVNSYTITKRQLTVTWSAASGLVYDKTEKGITVTIGNIYTNDIITFNIFNSGVSPQGTITSSGESTTLTCEFTAVNAGNYTASIVSLTADNYGSTNYSLPSNNGAWSIAPKTIGLSWSDDTDPVTYNFSFIYDGSEHGVRVEPTGVIEGDTVTLQVINNRKVDVGNYTATVVAIIEGSANYALPANRSRQWNITPRQITASWSIEDMSYDGVRKGVELTLSGAVEGDTVALVPQITAYLINTSTLLTNSGQYPDSGIAIALTSTGGPLTCELGGVKAGDYVCSISLSKNYADYPDNENYELAGETQTSWRIDRAVITLSWSAYGEDGVIYDGTAYGDGRGNNGHSERRKDNLDNREQFLSKLRHYFGRNAYRQRNLRL